MRWIAVFVSCLILAGCPLDSSDSKDPRGNIVILNEMTPTGLVRDGVTLDSIRGRSSAGNMNFFRSFSQPIAFEQSINVAMPRGECDVTWTIEPQSDEVTSFDDFATGVFLPCGETISCKATMASASGLTFSALECE